ncbi:MAG: hypothetical protein P0Y58_15240 [Candidatus Pseudomonas phytovorans]|uniref:Uncharacterized protein n=1 Tax=Candidatus Pseudomonas phytovorans TaxID=3121377 RepID=A0AAJ6BA21_9PSED|nr:hypothetical protein [Pseudomonas sp.]WEK28264.1 MAG: hypothetical protein P0Y58_15240 [Pseudomonas sp.]
MRIGALTVLFVSITFAVDVSAQSDELSPDVDGEKVILRVKVPSELAAREVEALYRSTVCTSVAYDVDGDPYKRDGYRRLDVQSVREGDTNVLRTELPVDRGGRCRWRLSNVTFGIKYGETSQFGESVAYGGGGGVIVLFDRSNSPGSGTAIKVEGDVDIRPDYYPWLSERFIGGYRKAAYLATNRSPYVRYLALSARRVNFEPVFHSGYLVRSVGPKIQRKGDFAIFHYSDGSSSTEGWGEPSFRKLQAIRKAAELESAK